MLNNTDLGGAVEKWGKTARKKCFDQLSGVSSTQKLVDTTPSKPPYLDNKVELHQFCSLTKK